MLRAQTGETALHVACHHGCMDVLEVPSPHRTSIAPARELDHPRSPRSTTHCERTPPRRARREGPDCIDPAGEDSLAASVRGPTPPILAHVRGRARPARRSRHGGGPRRLFGRHSSPRLPLKHPLRRDNPTKTAYDGGRAAGAAA